MAVTNPHHEVLRSTCRFRAALRSRLMTLSQVTHCFSRWRGPSTRKLVQAWQRCDVQYSSCIGGGGVTELGTAAAASIQSDTKPACAQWHCRRQEQEPEQEQPNDTARGTHQVHDPPALFEVVQDALWRGGGRPGAYNGTTWNNDNTTPESNSGPPEGTPRLHTHTCSTGGPRVPLRVHVVPRKFLPTTMTSCTPRAATVGSRRWQELGGEASGERETRP